MAAQHGQYFDSARTPSQQALLPALTNEPNLANPAGRTQQVDSFDSAITLVDSPTESMMVDGEGSKGTDL
jgi:hypothetical protein